MKKFFLVFLVFCAFLYGFDFSGIKNFFSEQNLIQLLKDYGYIIIFFWSIFEGETGLVAAGVLSRTGDMNLWFALITAALGGFAGDQMYFYLGKWNKTWVRKEFSQHRRKFAKAQLMLRKYGSWVIFFQRFIYGMRTIIPLSIGLTGYSSKKFAAINLLSAFVWSSVTIIPSFIFGEEILLIIKWLKRYWYIGILSAIVIFIIFQYFNKKEEK